MKEDAGNWPAVGTTVAPRRNGSLDGGVGAHKGLDSRCFRKS